MLPTPPPPDQLAALVRQLRSGDAAADAPRGTELNTSSSNTGETLELLRGAAGDGKRVWLWYVDAHGVASRRVVQPVNVSGGVLEGFDRTRGQLHRFALHRIMSAAVVSE